MGLLVITETGDVVDPDEVQAISARPSLNAGSQTTLVVHLKGGGIQYQPIPEGGDENWYLERLIDQVNKSRCCGAGAAKS